MKPTPRDFLQLTKPTIMLLVLLTGASALMVEGSMMSDPLGFLLVLLGLFATGGCANALNQYFERDIDAQMERTAKKRPLPSGRISPGAALVFTICLGIFGVVLFAVAFNWVSAALALATVLFYGFFYTLYLKPRTHFNIVIGGAAGAMAPPIAWAAATGSVAAVAPWVMFAIIFFWTPPHFWALAYCLRDQYKKVDYPMLPVVKGGPETLRQIVMYTVLLIAITLLMPLSQVGVIYIALAVVLGAVFLMLALKVRSTGEIRDSWGLFGYSIVYLLVLFTGIMVDAALTYQPWKG